MTCFYFILNLQPYPYKEHASQTNCVTTSHQSSSKTKQTTVFQLFTYLFHPSQMNDMGCENTTKYFLTPNIFVTIYDQGQLHCAVGGNHGQFIVTHSRCWAGPSDYSQSKWRLGHSDKNCYAADF